MSTQNNKTLFAIFASFVILQCACTTTSVDRIQDPRFLRLCGIFTSTNDSHEKLRVAREIASLIDYAIHTEGRKLSFRMIMDALGPPTFGSGLNFPIIQYDIPDVDNSHEYCLRFEGCTLQKTKRHGFMIIKLITSLTHFWVTRFAPFRAVTTNLFGYNARSEVTSALMGTNTYGYAYDPIGNRIEASHNAETNAYTANNLNQYTAIDDAVPTYDADGNMTSDGRGWRYFWNGENRMVCASNADVVVTYAYDHRGRMVRKEIARKDAEPQSITYTWDGWNIIREALATNHYPLATTYNVWGLDIDGTLQSAGGVGGLLAVVRDDDVFFPAYDANGNITEYVDASNGTVVAHYFYSPFGEQLVASGDLATMFTHRFSTKPWCANTGFNEYVYRKYRPDTGRWMSRDPIGDLGGVNPYSFLDNSTFLYDFVGTLSIDIADPIIEEGNPNGNPGGYNSHVSLSCECVGQSGDRQKIECTLEAKPIISLHPGHEEMFSYWHDEIITVLQHERNHHKVFLNVWVPSFTNLVAGYENEECCNCEELREELLARFKKLKTLLHKWELHVEYYSNVLQQEPALDYGTTTTIKALKDKSRTPCKTEVGNEQ